MGIAISLNPPASTSHTRNDVISNGVGSASQYALSNVTDPPRPRVRTTVVVIDDGGGGGVGHPPSEEGESGHGDAADVYAAEPPSVGGAGREGHVPRRFQVLQEVCWLPKFLTRRGARWRWDCLNFWREKADLVRD